MCSDNLLDLGDWSWLQETNYDEKNLESIKNYYQFDIDNEKIKNLYKQLPHSLQDEQGSYSSISSWTDRQTLTYDLFGSLKEQRFVNYLDGYFNEPRILCQIEIHNIF